MQSFHDAAILWIRSQDNAIETLIQRIKDFLNLICGELGGFPRRTHSAASFHSAKLDVRMSAHGGDFVCVADEA